MPRVGYALPMQGFRPRTNPSGALGRYGLRGLGDSNTFSGCVSAVDGQGNPVSCSDPSAAVWFDANMNAAQPGTPTPTSPTSSAAGAPTGSTLLYSATWQLSPSHERPNQILASVLQVLKSSASVIGFQTVNASQDAGLTTVSNFNVQIQLFVNGPGFGQPNDAGSFVDHAYNQVTGLMPVVSSTVVTSLPSGVSAAPAPTGTNPFPTGATSQVASWFETNALWIGLGVAAIVLLPALVKKL
jgi:hypothetical protein